MWERVNNYIASLYVHDFLKAKLFFSCVVGCKQSGVQLGHVVLPPWARGDPREFIRGHREVGTEIKYFSLFNDEKEV